ncbi:MAG: ATP-binding protein [Erysipelotrichaceae bacterium]|jgi:hypothetical protein|nr:ATP-binding protein [Erysipelotrichaceae bacterium]
MSNPFTPAFGFPPAILAGRDEIITSFLIALNNPGDPYRAVLFSGVRGIGKTALLTKLCEQAQLRGWISVSVLARKDMLKEMMEQLEMKAEEFLPAAKRVRLTGASVSSLGGVTWQNVPSAVKTWRTDLEKLLKVLKRKNIGVLFTIDEVDPKIEDLTYFIGTYQLLIRDGYPLALLMAGLPNKTRSLLNHDSIDFARKALLIKLKPLKVAEVKVLMSDMFAKEGKTIEEAALARLAAASDGYPFLIQMLGYHVFEASKGSEITFEEVEEGIKNAASFIETTVLEATLADLSDKDISFLKAMLKDPEDSLMADIAKRLKVTPSYAHQYKTRLIDQGVIEGAGRGKVTFAMPLLKQLMKEHFDGDSAL